MIRRRAGSGLVLVTLALVAVFTVIPLRATGPPRIGGIAPDFALNDLRGTRVQLATQLKTHRVTLVNFWATWCPPCRREIPELIAFYRRYKARGLQLLAVDLQEGPGEVREFAERQGMTFPILYDPDGRVAAKYGVYFIPTTFVLDGAGKIRAKIEGGATGGTLRAKTEPLLKGK